MPEDTITSEQRSALRDRRLAEASRTLAHWDGKHGQWFWLSFADDAGFRGSAIVRAPSAMEAPLVAHQKQCHPGGECLMVEIPFQEDASFFHPKWTNRLLSLAECQEMDREINRVHGTPPKRCGGCGVRLTGEPVQHREGCTVTTIDAEDAPGKAGAGG